MLVKALDVVRGPQLQQKMKWPRIFLFMGLLSNSTIPDFRVMRVFLLLISLFMGMGANAQQFYPSAANQALGGIQVTSQGIDAALGNPAGIVYGPNTSQKKVLLTAAVPYALAELKTVSAAFALPLDNNSAFSIAIQDYGFSDYREQQFRLSYVRKLADRIAITGHVDAFQTRITEYGSRLDLVFGLGFLAEISDQISWAGHVINPRNVERAEGDALSSVLRTGFILDIAKGLFVTVEVEKDWDEPLRLRTGFAYNLEDAFVLRLGFATEPSLFTFGLGYKISPQFQIDASASYHQQLGLSPGISAEANF